jgi:hypothetical protein
MSMATTRFTGLERRWGGWVLPAVVGVVLGLSGPAAAQPALRLTADANGKGADLLKAPDLLLRPNVSEPVYLFVDNPGGKATAVVVRCLAGQTPVAEFKGMVTQSQRIDFPKPAPNTPAVDLTGPLEIVLLDGTGKTLEKKTVGAKILEPREYLAAPAASFHSERRLAINRWSVRLQAAKGVFMGPPAKAQLIFSPQRIPGLLSPKPEGGVLNNEVTADGPAIELFATNLHFQPGTASNGLVLVTVDDYQRAFIFNTHFLPSGDPTPELVTRRGLHLAVPAHARPGTLTTPVEVDYPLRGAPVTLELGFDKTGKKGAYQLVTFSGPRQQKVGVSSADGHLIFKTEVSDWSHTWDTSGITGECRFRARLLDAQKKPIVFAERGRSVNEVFARVTFLDHPPTGVRLGKLPAEVTEGTPELMVTAGCSDPADQIASVFFFIGLPPKPVPAEKAGGKAADKDEVKPPEGAVRATRVVDRDGRVRWESRLKIPSEKPGSFAVTVQMMNQIGLSAFDTAQIKVAPPPPPPTTAIIMGKVVKGVNLKGQPGLPVILLDTNKKQVAEVKTDDQGNYQFKDVAPGSYTVTSEDATDKVRGSQPVTVRKGDKVTKDIELSRLGG